MKSDNDEDLIAAEKALEAARRLPVGGARIAALKHAGRLRFYAHKKRLPQDAKQDGLNELPETDPNADDSNSELTQNRGGSRTKNSR
jgi:hypothetical protein